jgi:lysozyme family protein
MADFDAAVTLVLRQEDSTLSGVVTHTKGDRGGATRFGISVAAYPALADGLFYTTMSTSDALQTATKIYRNDYWNKIQGDNLQSQDLANCLLSFAVVSGPSTAIRTLQHSLNLTEDGVMGPHTLAAANGANCVDNCKTAICDHYRQIALNDPTQQRFLQGWLNRVSLS